MGSIENKCVDCRYVKYFYAFIQAGLQYAVQISYFSKSIWLPLNFINQIPVFTSNQKNMLAKQILFPQSLKFRRPKVSHTR